MDENYISPENLNRPNVHTEIECVAFNYDSTWLVTIERRDDGSTTPETRLKFWQFDQANNKYVYFVESVKELTIESKSSL